MSYGIVLIRLSKGPYDKSIDWTLESPAFFDLRKIGGKPSHIFSDDFIKEVADLIGKFKINELSNQLNVPKSIRNSIENGGIPYFDFLPKTKLNSILILVDEYSDDPLKNRIPQELDSRLSKMGISVELMKFYHYLHNFYDKNGGIYSFDDLIINQEGIIILLFAEEKVLLEKKNFPIFDILCKWPMIAWIQIQPNHWTDPVNFQKLNLTIPKFPCTPLGIKNAFFSIFNKKHHNLEFFVPYHYPTLPIPFERLDLWLANYYGNVFPFLQDCSIFQPISFELANSIRERFYPNLPIDAVFSIFNLPNTTYSNAGVYFSFKVLKSMRLSMIEQKTEKYILNLVNFILYKIEEAKPDVPENSLTFLLLGSSYGTSKIRDWGR